MHTNRISTLICKVKTSKNI